MNNFYDWFNEHVTDEMINHFTDRTNKHMDLVQKYCKIIDGLFPNRFPGLIERGRTHDDSKFSQYELEPYIILTEKHRTKRVDNIDLELPDFVQEAMDDAWVHHYTVNDHHMNFYVPEVDGFTKVEVMPDKAVAEMCADWFAMSEELDSHTLDWVEDHMNVKWSVSKSIEDLIFEILNKVLETGKGQ